MKPAWTQRCSKALTLSYDDGVESDVRLLEILRKYGVKCTFNLNSGLDHQSVWEHHGYTVRRMDLEESVPLYAGHEIAVHGKFHRRPSELDAAQLHEEYADEEKLWEAADLASIGDYIRTLPLKMEYLNQIEQALISPKWAPSRLPFSAQTFFLRSRWMRPLFLMDYNTSRRSSTLP